MPTGLERGALVLRRFYRSSRLGALHPWRRAATWFSFPFVFAGLFSLNLLGQFGEWLSNLDWWTEKAAYKFRAWVESDREMDVHRRAWLRAHKPAKETEAARGL